MEIAELFLPEDILDYFEIKELKISHKRYGYLSNVRQSIYKRLKIKDITPTMDYPLL
jgi:hypothetical protein